MRLHKILALCCSYFLFASLLVNPSIAIAAPQSFSRIITIAAPNTAEGCINPLACLDASQSPFNQGGPFFVSGYYRFHKVADMPKDTSNTPSASVFGISVSDTGGKWQPFSTSFPSATSLDFRGLVLWYMAGELSMAGVKIENAAGEVIYDMESDESLISMSSTALARKGIWYLWYFGSYNEVLFTVTAPEVSLALVKGSRYTLDGTKLSGAAYGTDVRTVRSNFTNSETITAWRDGKQLSDSAAVTADTTFVYHIGQNDSVTYTLSPLTGDCNGDGKVDIRDLRAVKETSFGDLSSDNTTSLDINGDLRIDNSDISAMRNAITGDPLYVSQSIGAEALLSIANPIGRLHKDNHMLFMEHSATNFTLTGQLQGDVTATLLAEQARSPVDQSGLFIEVDGKMRYEKISAYSEYVNITLAKDLSPGMHTIRVYKAADAANDVIYISAVRYCGHLVQTAAPQRRIEFLGDSITAGIDVFPIGSVQHQVYGAATSYYSYAKMTADLLDASHYCVANSGWRLCYSLNPQYTIRSVYPYQSMRSAYSGGEYSFDWSPHVIVINLGTNDRFTADAASYRTDTLQLLQLVRQKHPNAAIIWAYGAMDSRHCSCQWIRDAVNEFATTDGNAYYVALPQNNNGANTHPSEAGQRALAQLLAERIRQIMGW